jgi:hypothetical protein
MDSIFAISRRDGRSNQQVVLDLVSGAEPGTLYTYDALGAALRVGTDQEFPRRRVHGIVRSALKRLLIEQERTLPNVRGVGYKLAHATEHMSLALARRRRADSQLRMGMRLLQHVRWTEMDPNARTAHMGMLMVTEALYRNQQALERRQANVEDVLARLKSRLDTVAPEQ